MRRKIDDGQAEWWKKKFVIVIALLPRPFFSFSLSLSFASNTTMSKFSSCKILDGKPHLLPKLRNFHQKQNRLCPGKIAGWKLKENKKEKFQVALQNFYRSKSTHAIHPEDDLGLLNTEITDYDTR